jgi:tetratricopeptide (TPR) repeat protein
MKDLCKSLIRSALIVVILVYPIQSQIIENTHNITNIITLGEYSTKIDIDGVARIGKHIQVPDTRINSRALIKLGRVSQIAIIDNNTSTNIEFDPEMVDISLENATAARESEPNSMVEKVILNETVSSSFTDASIYPPGFAPAVSEFGSNFPALIVLPVHEESAKRKEALYWLEKGNENYSSQNWGDALQCYERGIKLDNQNAHLWYSKGNALLKMRQYNDAVAAYDEATNLDPNYKNAWKAKCVILNAIEPTSQRESVACYKANI